MEFDPGTSGDFQRSTRMPLDAVVRLHFEGTVAYQNGFAANVSASGMFVKHPAPPPVGTELVFEFSLGAQRRPVQGTGDVVWVRDRYLGPGQPAGIGIRFTQLDHQSRDHIAEALFEYLEKSLLESPDVDTEALADQLGAVPTAAAPTSRSTASPVASPAPGADDPVSAEPNAGDSGTRRIDLSSLATLAPAEPLPLPAAPPTSDSERAPFSVFSSLDSADAGTAAIVRDALRDAPRVEPPSIAIGGAARAAGSESRSRTGLWLGLLLGLAALGAAGWFGWQRWNAPRAAAAAPVPAAEPAPEPPAREPLPSTVAPNSTLAENLGVDTKERSPAAEPPISRAATPAPAESEDEDGTANTRPGAAEADESPAPPAESRIDIRPATPTAATSTAAGARATEIRSLGWSADGATLLVAADGAFAPGSFSYSEIGGDNPRVLVKLKGIERPFRAASTGASPLARGVRTGFHTTGSTSEIHVVVDLARPAPKVVELAPVPEGLALRLAPR